LEEGFEVFKLMLPHTVDHPAELQDSSLEIRYDDDQLMKDNVQIGNKLIDVLIILVFVEAAIVADGFFLKFIGIQGLLNELKR